MFRERGKVHRGKFLDVWLTSPRLRSIKAWEDANELRNSRVKFSQTCKTRKALAKRKRWQETNPGKSVGAKATQVWGRWGDGNFEWNSCMYTSSTRSTRYNINALCRSWRVTVRGRAEFNVRNVWLTVVRTSSVFLRFHQKPISIKKFISISL